MEIEIDEAEKNFYEFLTLQADPANMDSFYSLKKLKPTDKDGKEARFQLMLRNPPSYAIVSSFGATLTALVLPDKNGQLEDCVLGFDSKSGYDTRRCFGGTVGRIANRIQNAQFTLPNGKSYKVDANSGVNEHLHGGFGWHRKFWDV